MEDPQDPMAHQGLVAEVAWKYRGAGRAMGLDLEDLRQEGFLGLMRACELFDEGRKNEFSTYAYEGIRHAILDAINSQARPVRIPIYLRKRVLKLRKQAPKGVTLESLPLGRKRRQSLKAAILLMDGERADLDRDTLLDEVPVSPQEDIAAAFAEVAPRLARLDERNRLIITKRFGLDGEPPRNLRQIGMTLSLTRERIRQLEVLALARLREPA